MPTSHTCPACGAILLLDRTCQDDFHQMLYWEAEFPAYGAVHHLLVLCYHLQHPALYSPAALELAQQMLADFLAGTSPADMRDRLRNTTDSGQRTWKVTGTAASHGSYAHPVQWTMTARDVVQAGAACYITSVRAWARSICDALTASGNLT